MWLVPPGLSTEALYQVPMRPPVSASASVPVCQCVPVSVPVRQLVSPPLSPHPPYIRIRDKRHSDVVDSVHPSISKLLLYCYLTRRRSIQRPSCPLVAI